MAQWINVEVIPGHRATFNLDHVFKIEQAPHPHEGKTRLTLANGTEVIVSEEYSRITRQIDAEVTDA